MTDVSDDGTPTSQTPAGARLTGWKEIGAYLDRGVRTVQRWERDYGLPVRRMGGGGAAAGRSESVFAFVSEVDEWLDSSSGATARGQKDTPAAQSRASGAGPSGIADADATGTHTIVATPAEPPARQRWLLWALAGAVLVLATVGLWRELSTGRALPLARGGLPVDWRTDPNALVVVDASGNQLWSHPFPGRRPDSDWMGSGATLGGVRDLDGDGLPEVWFVNQPADPSQPSTLNLFDHDGHERWSYSYTGTARFGSVDYGPPWMVLAAFVTPAPESADLVALWVVSRDSAEFPSVLQRLDVRTGRPAGGAYWSHGWIGSVALQRTASGPRLIVCASNNEHRSPSVAVLDALDITGAAPAEQDKYRCMDCPARLPLAYAVLVKPRRFDAAPGAGNATISNVNTDAEPIVVGAHYASDPRPGAPLAAAVFHLDATLRPLYADVSDTYTQTYRALVHAGRVPDAGPVPSDASRDLLPTLLWQTDRFVPVDLDRQPIPASSGNAASPGSRRRAPRPASRGPQARTPRVLRP